MKTDQIYDSFFLKRSRARFSTLLLFLPMIRRVIPLSLKITQHTAYLRLCFLFQQNLIHIFNINNFI